MSSKSLSRFLFLILTLAINTRIYAQEEPIEEQSTTPISDLKSNETVQQHFVTPNNKDITNGGDKYNANGASYNTFSKASSSYSAANTDLGTPVDSPFQLGGDITGTIQNSINQVTGKITFSIPLASVSSGTVSYSLGLGYNGQTSFKIGREQNKYSPASIVGVGWSLSTPKIVVNNKQTTTRTDDEFYMIDGASNSKLICTDFTGSVKTFQLEKFANWKITYSTIFDSWTVIKEDGKTYVFGENGSSKSKEYISTWGNWIGDSNQTPTGRSTIVWNLSRIKDQWNNRIYFRYEQVEGRQNTSQTYNKHTEASYLKEIISSKGAKIKLLYNFKGLDFDYFEFHREKSEPDAYQERYEKKYLKKVELYNNNNQIITSYDLGYTVNGGALNVKRYLTSLTQISHKNGQSFPLPPQEFQYHFSGTFKGGLKKIIYPSGGSVTYNYQNKYLFYNGANKFATFPSWPSGYSFYSAVVRDNYSLFVMRTTTPVTGSKHRFIFFRYWWNGQKWESNQFTFPHLIEDHYPNSGERLKNFYSILEDDFYGFAYDKGSTADIYLFHKEKNGTSWKYYTHSSLNIANENPSFIAGDGFVALGAHRAGRLYTYVWNGSTWHFKQINQGGGQYYYAAKNNFILSLDEDGGPDMVTNISYADNYYIHYLDAEKKWQTKSWSASASPHINSIEKPSHFFPGNSIAGFVADDNPELFLRWDKHYNLVAVDNVLGWYNDAHSLQPVNNSMFTLVWWFDRGPTKTARFNGVNWSVSNFSSANYKAVNFGIDFMTYKNENSNQIMYKEYSPNYHNWVSNNVNWCPWYTSFQVNAINTEFFIARNKIFKRTHQGPPAFPTLQIGTLQYDNDFTYSDGLSHAFVKEVQYTDNGGSASSEFKKGTYFYVNKENGLLSSINLGLKYHLRGSNKLGGYTPFMSPRALWVRHDNTPTNFNPYLYRIIDDKFNQSFYDIVVSSIDLNDDNGNIRKIKYTYNNPNSTPDNSITYYGDVTVENKGFGVSSIGKVKKIFNTGTTDIQMAGLQLEEQILDNNNELKRRTTNVWQKFLKTAHNGSFQIDLGYYIGLKTKKEEQFFGSKTITNITNYYYNSKGQLSSTNTKNSKGQIERQNVRYAHEQYSFVRDKNMISDTYEVTTRLDNIIVDVKRNVWGNVGGKVYVTEKWSGPSLTKMRLNTKITNIDYLGNLLETTDGKNIYNSVLNGYGNLYEVASIVNAKYQDIVNQLDVSYSQLQNLSTSSLKVELLKLYDRLPNAMISLTFYDDNGRVINKVNERKEESYIYYDSYGRLDYITDGYGKVIEKKEYHFGN